MLISMKGKPSFFSGWKHRYHSINVQEFDIIHSMLYILIENKHS